MPKLDGIRYLDSDYPDYVDVNEEIIWNAFNDSVGLPDSFVHACARVIGRIVGFTWYEDVLEEFLTVAKRHYRKTQKELAEVAYKEAN